jgi:hypothetical protein
MSKKGRNIQFLRGAVKYNAIKRFPGGIIKIPSYVIAEVLKSKTRIDIYHQNDFVVSYDSTNLYKHIRKIEPKVYKGKFKYQDITYKLNQIEI